MSVDNKKIIIAIEGIDGAGKTTLTRLIEAHFYDQAIIYSRTEKTPSDKKVLRSKIIDKCHAFQSVFYLVLSHKNSRHIPKDNSYSILIMDRCFLSNICYFYPRAMNNQVLFRIALLFEPKLIPSDIFIIDEDPTIAHVRDNMEKELGWLEKTREIYLSSATKNTLSKFNVSIIPNNLSIDEKAEIIIKRIKAIQEGKNGIR